ncbi:hypothetical protein SALBM311S_02221 [Streptomyces alboniger]
MASPPAIQTIDSYAANEAWAAWVLVALESSMYVTPATSATFAMRCASGVKARRPSRTAAAGTP